LGQELQGVSDVIDPSNLDAHIWTLRSRLGVKNRKRIQTVKGVGYMYISSGKGAEDETVRGGTV